MNVQTPYGPRLFSIIPAQNTTKYPPLLFCLSFNYPRQVIFQESLTQTLEGPKAGADALDVVEDVLHGVAIQYELLDGPHDGHTKGAVGLLGPDGGCRYDQEQRCEKEDPHGRPSTYRLNVFSTTVLQPALILTANTGRMLTVTSPVSISA